jgi:hypothetical protein
MGQPDRAVQAGMGGPNLVFEVTVVV